ncbi:hypothetical protein CANARDRAFT_235452 [[Candida] arabinofermentans NRRL YB-2248]|uniref:Transcription regulator Rua1 C-terminal domain-containing protein n=1 Tax=[Candida] arabinofermentans NRRL YB-2248 TaxID=983967 RepID=A0A1E4SZE8_9ASCO|nr:hypothetical protein CANARDRAFT_235452 [[Candida] arabinofermentans NRRL YB-2248]
MRLQEFASVQDNLRSRKRQHLETQTKTKNNLIISEVVDETEQSLKTQAKTNSDEIRTKVVKKTIFRAKATLRPVSQYREYASKGPRTKDVNENLNLNRDFQLQEVIESKRGDGESVEETKCNDNDVSSLGTSGFFNEDTIKTQALGGGFQNDMGTDNSNTIYVPEEEEDSLKLDGGQNISNSNTVHVPEEEDDFLELNSSNFISNSNTVYIPGEDDDLLELAGYSSPAYLSPALGIPPLEVLMIEFSPSEQNERNLKKYTSITNYFNLTKSNELTNWYQAQIDSLLTPNNFTVDDFTIDDDDEYEYFEEKNTLIPVRSTTGNDDLNANYYEPLVSRRLKIRPISTIEKSTGNRRIKLLDWYEFIEAFEAYGKLEKKPKLFHDHNGVYKLGPIEALCPYCPTHRFYTRKNSSYLHHVTTVHGTYSNGEAIPLPILGEAYEVQWSKKTNTKTYKVVNVAECQDCHNVVKVWFSQDKTEWRWNSYHRHVTYCHMHHSKTTHVDRRLQKQNEFRHFNWTNLSL